MFVESAAGALELPDVVIEQRAEPRHEDVVERAVITFRGQDYAVAVVNISSRGTMIESDLLPRLGESLTIRFENCSRIHGFVRWMRGGQLGIRFGHEIILAS
jgi:hypothetical protein